MRQRQNRQRSIISFIRTLTVGPGVSPDLLTFLQNEGSARGLYRRWGLSPRPEFAGLFQQAGDSMCGLPLQGP